jgi:hypothetical protein
MIKWPTLKGLRGLPGFLEIESPKQEEDILTSSNQPNSSDQTITAEHRGPQQRLPQRRGLPQPWSMAQNLPDQRPRKILERYINQTPNIAYASVAAQEIDSCDKPRSYYEGAAQEIDSCDEPISYYEAISSVDFAKWIAAMQEEVESLHKNETWDLVELPEGKRAISCKWLFKIKEGIPSVENARFKARYVVRGFDQEEGIDFNEVFSLVVRHTSIRVLLALVALHDLELRAVRCENCFFTW